MVFIMIQLVASFFFLLPLNTNNASVPPPPCPGHCRVFAFLVSPEGGGEALANFVWSGHLPTLDTNVVSYPDITKHCLSNVGNLLREIGSYRRM